MGNIPGLKLFASSQGKAFCAQKQMMVSKSLKREINLGEQLKVSILQVFSTFNASISWSASERG